MKEVGKSLLQLNLASIIRNIYGIVRAKATTLMLGVTGVGILGQIFTLHNVQSKFVTFGIEAFLINRLGKLANQQNSSFYFAIILYSGAIILISNGIILILCFVFLRNLTNLIFGSEIYTNLLFALILLGPVFAVSGLFEIITQARLKFSHLSIGRNIGSIAGIISFIPLVYVFDEMGIILSLYVFTISSGVYYVAINRELFSTFFKIPRGFLKEFYEYFIKLGFTDILRKTLAFGSFLIFRIIIVQHLGLEENGRFQAIWSISFYPDIFIGAFITYFFPTMSKIVDSDTLRNEISKNYTYLIHIVFPIIALIMIVPDLFLLIFYNASFLSEQYDLKVLAYLKLFQSIYHFFTIIMLSQTNLRYFLISELIRYISLLVFASWLIPLFSFQGAIYSYMLMEFFSLLVIIYVLFKKSDFRISNELITFTLKLAAILGLLLISDNQSLMLRIIIFLVFFTTAYLSLDIQLYRRLISGLFKK